MQHDERLFGNSPIAAAALARDRGLAVKRAIHPERDDENVLVRAEPGGELILEPLRAHDVGIGLPQRLECLPQKARAHTFAPALAPIVGRRAQHHDGHEIVHSHYDGPPACLLDHMRVAVVEHVHEIGALRLALDSPRIEVVAGRPLLWPVEGTGQDDARGIDRLRPPPHEGRAATVALVGTRSRTHRIARQRSDVRRQPDVKSELTALEPIVQAMGIPVHRRPAFEREIGYQEDGRHYLTICCQNERVLSAIASSEYNRSARARAAAASDRRVP